MQIRYKAVLSIAQTYRKSTFFAISCCFSRIDLGVQKATVEFYQCKLKSVQIVISQELLN